MELVAKIPLESLPYLEDRLHDTIEIGSSNILQYRNGHDGFPTPLRYIISVLPDGSGDLNIYFARFYGDPQADNRWAYTSKEFNEQLGVTMEECGGTILSREFRRQQTDERIII